VNEQVSLNREAHGKRRREFPLLADSVEKLSF
jgi:hypothetical protein